MKRFSEVDWSELTNGAEDPVALCLRNEFAVYTKVRRDLHRVYRHHLVALPAGSPRESLHLVGFDDELVFLQPENEALCEIAASGSAFVNSFHGNGFASPRPYDVVGHFILGRREMREYKRNSDPHLKEVQLREAFLVDRGKWARIGLDCPLPEQECRVAVEIHRNDLYLKASDVELLRRRVQDATELTPYPYSHRERMPGIFLMFQAAYARNALGTLKDASSVTAWLRRKAGKATFRYKSILTAEKFGRLNLDRAKGVKMARNKGRLSFDDLAEWTDSDKYLFPFISKEFSFILAIADWWLEVLEREPNESLAVLAKRLEEWKFRGLEVEHLVYLIGGSRWPPE